MNYILDVIATNYDNYSVLTFQIRIYEVLCSALYIRCGLLHVPLGR